jgi:hypothetical protein
VRTPAHFGYHPGGRVLLFHFIGDTILKREDKREAKMIQTGTDKCDIVVGNIRIKDIPAKLARRVIERLA